MVCSPHIGILAGIASGGTKSYNFSRYNYSRPLVYSEPPLKTNNYLGDKRTIYEIPFRNNGIPVYLQQYLKQYLQQLSSVSTRNYQNVSNGLPSYQPKVIADKLYNFQDNFQDNFQNNSNGHQLPIPKSQNRNQLQNKSQLQNLIHLELLELRQLRNLQHV